MVGFCTSPRFVEHETGPYHPERPDRIRAIFAAVRAAGLVDSPNPFSDFHVDFQLSPIGGEKLLELSPRLAEQRWIELVHTKREIQYVRNVCANGGGVLDQGDTPVCAASFEIARLSCGGVLEACDAVLSGKCRRAFSAGRPPGHHAEPDRPMGFCLFSNVAVAARYLQQQHGVGTVAIVDFDVHHGNGTQAAFEDDPSVLFISLHENPRTCYPGSGFEYEVGQDAGRGTKLNIPLPPGTGDDEYLRIFQAKVLPKLDLYKPQMLLVSAGFDGHVEDPLAHLELSEDGFFQITRLLAQAADVHCGGKLVSALEGGYNLRALGRSVVKHLDGLRFMMIADAHLDLSYNALRGRDVTESARQQPAIEDEIATVGFPDLKTGGVGLVCATIFCEPQSETHPGYRTADEAHAMMLEHLQWYRQRIEGGSMRLEIEPSLSPLSTILLLEGADGIRHEGDIDLIYRAGVRIVGLAWRRTRYAGGTGQPGGLTDQGKTLVRKLDQRGMIHDASHLAEESFWDLLDISPGKVIASHSNCRAIVPTDRQISDEMIRAIAHRGGVIGINFFDKFLLSPHEYGKRRANLTDVVRHVRHICDLCGNCDHVGLGTDMDGGLGREQIPVEIETSADLPRVAEALSNAGFGDQDIAEIMAGNWVRFFRECGA